MDVKFVKYLTICWAVIFLSSCSITEIDDQASASLTVENRFPVLRLKNNGQASLRYFVIEERSSYLINMVFEPEKLPKLVPRQRVVIPYEEILGYDEEASIIRVFWVTEGKWDAGNLIHVEL